MKPFKTLALILLSVIVHAQNLEQSALEFQKKTKAKITVNKSGIPNFIIFPANNSYKQAGNTIQEKAFQFLINNASLFKCKDVNSEFVLNKIEKDNINTYRVILNQHHNNVPIYDGKLIFHFNKNKQLTAINGNYISNIKLNIEPIINETQARLIALETIKNQDINYSNKPLLTKESKLFIFKKGLAQGYNGANYLVYKVEVLNEKDVREYLFVNAHDGTIVEQFTGMPHALNRVVYEQNTSTIAWQEGDAFPGSLTIWQQNQVETAAHVYNFFKNAFGYTSYDNADAQMRSINNDPAISCPNANWNGFTVNFCDGIASDDVVGHEWAHAYTEYTNGLIYQWQSGAINEAYSDIWGETIDLLNNYEDVDDDHTLRTACTSSDRWILGEDATVFTNGLRDMWDPTCKGDPGKVTDTEYACGTDDSGGVHTNSGIPNHAYVLLVDGGSYNNQTITAIGFTKAAHIFWRAQSQYLTQTSDFSSLTSALEASANDLIGVNLEGLSTSIIPAGLSGEIITASDVQQVINATIAVEMTTNPAACNYTTLLDTTPVTLCNSVINSPIYYEDWESGLNSWTVYATPTNPATWETRNWNISNNLPNRTGNAAFGINPINGDCLSDLENGIITIESPTITLPNANSGNYEMAFNHYVATERDWDGGNIKISINGGSWSLIPQAAFTMNSYNSTINSTAVGNDNPMASEAAFTGTDDGSHSGSWATSVIDLTSIGVLASDTIKFRFELGSDGCNGRVGWYIDELTVYNCNINPLSVTSTAISNAVAVYPNPSKGIYTLKKNSSLQLQTATIYDINGRLIKTISLVDFLTNKRINLSQMASGMYFLELATPNQIKTVIKLIKE